MFEAEVQRVVGKSWHGFRDLGLVSRIRAMGETLSTWGNKADSRFRWRKRELESKVKFLQDITSARGRVEYVGAREELGHLLVHEETFWRQVDKYLLA